MLCNYGGITPAGAGKTFVKPHEEITAWDHPRRCGENKNGEILFAHLKGSPPQVRGKPGISLNSTSWSGITPAGAGKTTM